MLAIERRNEILSVLQQEHRVLVSDLSHMYKVTEETIRRDLEKLEKLGLAKKTYGGAILNESLNMELPYTVRKKANIKQKKYIAGIVSAMIEDGDSIMLDSSTTALFIAKNIKHKDNITLITNSIEILLELSDKTGWRILSTGGIFKEDALSFVGHHAEKMLEDFFVDKAVISCKGIDREYGISDSNEMDAGIKNAMLKSSKLKILVADHSKFDKKAFVKITDIKDINTIVTDSCASKEWKDFLLTSNIEIKD